MATKTFDVREFDPVVHSHTGADTPLATIGCIADDEGGVEAVIYLQFIPSNHKNRGVNVRGGDLPDGTPTYRVRLDFGQYMPVLDILRNYETRIGWQEMKDSTPRVVIAPPKSEDDKPMIGFGS